MPIRIENLVAPPQPPLTEHPRPAYFDDVPHRPQPHDQPVKHRSYAQARRMVGIVLAVSAAAVVAIGVYLLVAWSGSLDKQGGAICAAWMIIGVVLLTGIGAVADVFSESVQAQIQEAELARTCDSEEDEGRS